MKRDTLLEAAHAHRDEEDEALLMNPPPAGETRARVLSSLRRRRSRNVMLVRIGVPMAAVLAGSLAWAAAAGKIANPFRVVEPAPSTPVPALTSARPTSMAPRAPASADAPADNRGDEDGGAPPAIEAPADHRDDAANREPVAREPRAPVAPAPPRSSAHPAVAASASALAASVPSAPAHESPPPAASAQAAEAALSEEDALYRTAHRLHFVEHNPSAAIAAWDAYLKAAPRGRLSIEARYNRALSLLRVGRTAEAQKALEGFARGDFGEYRRAEARALLDAMKSAE